MTRSRLSARRCTSARPSATPTPRGQRPAGGPPRQKPSRKQQTLLARKYNVTDPDSGIVRHRGMLMQGYNVQTAVADGQVILAVRATNTSPDGGQLHADPPGR